MFTIHGSPCLFKDQGVYDLCDPSAIILPSGEAIRLTTTWSQAMILQPIFVDEENSKKAIEEPIRFG